MAASHTTGIGRMNIIAQHPIPIIEAVISDITLIIPIIITMTGLCRWQLSARL
jgi:hypothetical protein